MSLRSSFLKGCADSADWMWVGEISVYRVVQAFLGWNSLRDSYRGMSTLSSGGRNDWKSTDW